MTREEAIDILGQRETCRECVADCTCKECDEAFEMAIKALEQEPCEDAISRADVLDLCESKDQNYAIIHFKEDVECLPSISTEKIGRCKDCKHFVYDEFAIVNGIPIIVAHEICSKWGNGCRTKEDGYCHMFEPKMQEVKE